MRGLSTPSALMIAPQLFSLSKEFTRPKFDPDGAKKLLTEAGYPDGFEVTMDCPNDRYVNDSAICQAVVGMLARIGVKVDLLAQPKQQYFAKVLKPGGYQTSFYLLGWTPASMDSHNVLHDIMGCRDDPRTRPAAKPISAATATRSWMRSTDKVLVETDTGQARSADQAGVRNRHQGLRLYPAAPAGAGLGRLEKGETDPACGQPGAAVLGDQTGVGSFERTGPGGFALPGLFVSGLAMTRATPAQKK